jgi:GTP-binding protein
MFRDEARIFVKAGEGGRGAVSFRREKFVPKGGPDGGDGGDGGSVILVADPGENTLLSLARAPHFRAESGQAGQGDHCAGRSGANLRIRVPVGTLARDEETGIVLKDLRTPGEEVVVARGGRGGRGNARFKSATHQTPREFEEGRPGESRTLRLELKLIADVGLLGLPNAGKSTLISAVSAARPRIADYPFTTLDPHPGIVDLPGYRRFVMMDIPGLIEGAHRGQGLGDRFLRHVERTRVLVHLLEIAPLEGGPDPAARHATILEEIRAFGQGLLEKPRITVYSKADLVADPEAAAAELNARLGLDAYPVSAVTGLNLTRLLEDCWRLLQPGPGEMAAGP